MRGMKITALAFALLLTLNACGSHQPAAPAEPSEAAETAEAAEAEGNAHENYFS